MKKNVLAVVAVAVYLMLGCASNQPSNSTGELLTSSDQTDVQKRAQVRLQLAIGYFQQRELRVALDEIKLALQVDPSLADAYSVRGLIYMEMGENPLAEENLLRALSLDRANPDFNNNYGWFLCQNGRANLSVAYFESALKIRTYQSPVKALNNAGVCSMKLKNEVDAERYFSQAFKYEPSNTITNINLAKIYYGRRDYERARFYMGRVAKGDELSPDTLWLAIKIERKMGDRAAETSLVTQLRRRHPNSEEYAAYKRGAFDE